MFIYIGGVQGLHVYRGDATGADWQCVQHLPGEVNPARFVLNASNTRLYCLHADRPFMSAFAIERLSGHLRLVNRVYAGGLGPASAAFSSDGRYLLVAHDGSPHVGVIPLAADGALRPVSQVIALPGQARARDVIIDPGGHFAVLTDRGENNLLVLRFNAASGHAALHQIIRARPADVPHRAAFHPTMPLLYVSNAGNSTLTAYHWNAAVGRISFAQSIRAIPSDWQGKNITADIAISPDGRYLYVTNRGHDSIAIFAIQPGRGKLFTRARETPGQTPHGFARDGRGGMLLVANRDGNSIARYAVILANGMLTRQEIDIPITQPTAIALVD